MNCETARERMLELARHLQACERCRRQSKAILDQYTALRSELERQTPRLDPADPRWRRASPRVHTWRFWPVIVPVALAASLAVLLVARRYQPGLVPPAPVPTVGATGAGLDVQGPPGKAVAVFQTDNPNIVVIWSF
jgi:anti-sigma factor RsiW